MAPKTCELSVATREKIIFLHNSGLSYREIGKQLNVNFSSVRYVIKKKKETGSTINKQRTGRPRKLDPRQRRAIIKESSKNPFLSARELAVDVASTSGTIVTPQTIRNILHSANIRGRAPRKKPFISERNRVKRLEFAKAYVSKPLEFWKNVIFSDESKFNIFGSDGKKTVWRKPNTSLQIKNLIPTIKHGGGHIMIWGCMSFNGVGEMTFIEGNMNAKQYIDILRDNLSNSALKLGIPNSYYFQQDNDPKHTAYITRLWLLYNVKNQLQTPPQSPDLNPIENLWHTLDRKIRKKKISNKSELKQALTEAWLQISNETCQKLIESMPRRLQAVIEAKGMHTKY